MTDGLDDSRLVLAMSGPGSGSGALACWQDGWMVAPGALTIWLWLLGWLAGWLVGWKALSGWMTGCLAALLVSYFGWLDDCLDGWLPIPCCIFA